MLIKTLGGGGGNLATSVKILNARTPGARNSTFGNVA